MQCGQNPEQGWSLEEVRLCPLRRGAVVFCCHGDVEVQNKHDLAAETADSQRLHERLFLFRSLHSHETNGLLGAFMHGCKDVQSRDAAELTAQLMQCGPQAVHITVLPEFCQCAHFYPFCRRARSQC